MTQFSFEVPLKHLEYFDKYQDFYFALSFLCRKSEEYFKFIRQKAKKSYVVLDNSYNELNKPDDPKELAKIFWALKAHAVVSPDSDSWTTQQLAIAYYDMIYEVPTQDVWVVVRNEGELNKFKYAAKRCSTFLHRPVQECLHRCEHYLGYVDPVEIVLFEPESCDTSMPLKLALKGMTVQEWIFQGCPHYHTQEWRDFFDLELTKEQLELSVENIRWIKKGATVKTALSKD